MSDKALSPQKPKKLSILGTDYSFIETTDIEECF
jgi:hypothetical protein